MHLLVLDVLSLELALLALQHALTSERNVGVISKDDSAAALCTNSASAENNSPI